MLVIPWLLLSSQDSDMEFHFLFGFIVHGYCCSTVLRFTVRTLRGRAVEAALSMLGATGSESTQHELATSVASVCQRINVTDPDGYLHAIYEDGSGLFQALMYVVCYRTSPNALM